MKNIWNYGFIIFVCVGLYFSYTFYISFSSVILVMGVTLEIFKSIFIKSFYSDTHKFLISYIKLIIGIISIIFSLMASMSVFINEAEILENESYKTVRNEKYTLLENNKKEVEKSIEDIQDKIKEYDTERQTKINSIDPSWVTSIQKYNTYYDNLIEKKEKSLTTFQNDLTDLNTKLQATKKETKIKQDVKGNALIFSQISKMLGLKQEKISFIFYLILSLTIEASIIISSIQAKIYNIEYKKVDKIKKAIKKEKQLEKVEKVEKTEKAEPIIVAAAAEHIIKSSECKGVARDKLIYEIREHLLTYNHDSEIKKQDILNFKNIDNTLYRRVMEVLKEEGTIISKNKNKYYLNKRLGVVK